MTDIRLNEVSGVDFPAHLVHGFAVIKSADPTKNEALLSALRKETMPTEDETLDGVLKNASIDDVLKALSDEQRAEFEKAFAPKKKVPADEQADKGVDDPDADDEVKKAVQVQKAAFDAEIAKRDQEIADLRQNTEIEKAARLDGEAIAKSEKEFSALGFDHKVVAPALRKFAETNSEAAAALDTMLKAVNAQSTEAGIFKTVGTNAEGDAVEKSADEQIVAKAQARADEKNIPFHKAYEQIVAENPELVSKHFNGGK